MAETFRQEVIEIMDMSSCKKDLCKKYRFSSDEYDLTDCRQCRIDRICAAAVEMGKRMPKKERKAKGVKDIDGIMYNSGAFEQLEADQDHIAKECKGE